MKINLSAIDNSTDESTKRKLLTMKKVAEERSKSELSDIDSKILKIKEVYSMEIFIYLKGIQYKLAPGLYVAISKRLSGERYLSPRELDVAARIKIDLSDSSLMDFALMEVGCTIIDGMIGDVPTSWNLRLRYNNGIAWVRRNGNKHKRYSDAIEKLDELSFHLTNKGLPLWKEEKESGFHEELLTPEYMTPEAYHKESKEKIKFIA